jgi:4-azaleucine resistance transporter AzlC
MAGDVLLNRDQQNTWLPDPPSGIRRKEFFLGVRDELPLLVGVVPFGLIFGALAISAGIPAFSAQAFSLFVFAGSAQFIALGLITKGSTVPVIVLTILVVNLRHLLYSANLSPKLADLPLRWKMGLAWLLTDEAFAVASARYQQREIKFAHWYTLGAGLTLFLSWQLSTLGGILLGARIPDSWSLDFAVPLTFIAILAVSIKDRTALMVAVIAGLLAAVLYRMPFQVGLILSAILAIGLGVLSERIQTKDGVEIDNA